MLPLRVVESRDALPTKILEQRVSVRTQHNPSLSSGTPQATAKAEPEALQRRRAAEFLKAYEPFDWTAQL